MSGYIGTTPTPQATQTRNVFTATSGQTSFATSGYTPTFLDVYVNGSHLKNGTDYTASNGSDVVMASGLAAGDYVEIVAFTTFSTSDTVPASNGGTFSGDVTFADGADIITASAGTSNFRAGVNAGNSIQSGGNYNVVVGDEAGTAITTGDNNTAIGFEALAFNNTGFSNVSVGYQAQYANTIGNHNVGIGLNALDANTAGDRNVAVGSRALTDFNVTSTADTYNTAVGYNAGARVTTGVQNTAVGGLALDALTDADYNVAVGYNALTSDTLGSRSTAIGHDTLANQNFTSATNTYNTAVGQSAGFAITTGTENTLVGGLAGDAITTAGHNVAVGYGSLTSNTTGAYNVGLGHTTLASNTTANYNTAAGYRAGYNNTTGTLNTFVGGDAGLTNTTSSYSTYLGYVAGENTTGEKNTFLGQGAGSSVTTGADNTIIGRYNGNQGGLDIRTSSNNIVLSDGDGNPRGVFNSAGSFHVGSPSFSFAGSSDCVQIAGNEGRINIENDTTSTQYVVAFYNTNGLVGRISTSGSSTSYNTSSDYRLKENVVELTGATDRLKQLEPKRFNFIVDDTTTVDGFLAHKVQTVVPEAITGTHNEVDDDGNPVYQGIDQSKLVPLLTAALQEAIAKIETLETKVAALESE